MTGAFRGLLAFALVLASAPLASAGGPPCNPFCELVDLGLDGNCDAVVVVCLGGNSEGDVAAASVAGNSASPLVAVSQSGNANGGAAAMSWSGNAAGLVAVSVCGDAEGVVAVGLGLQDAAPALCPTA